MAVESYCPKAGVRSYEQEVQLKIPWVSRINKDVIDTPVVVAATNSPVLVSVDRKALVSRETTRDMLRSMFGFVL